MNERPDNEYGPHNRRCLICGRTWRHTVGPTLASGACLQCGATPDQWERAPDGIDFRSQHTVKGDPGCRKKR